MENRARRSRCRTRRSRPTPNPCGDTCVKVRYRSCPRFRRCGSLQCRTSRVPWPKTADRLRLEEIPRRRWPRAAGATSCSDSPGPRRKLPADWTGLAVARHCRSPGSSGRGFVQHRERGPARLLLRPLGHAEQEPGLALEAEHAWVEQAFDLHARGAGTEVRWRRMGFPGNRRARSAMVTGFLSIVRYPVIDDHSIDQQPPAVASRFPPAGTSTITAAESPDQTQRRPAASSRPTKTCETACRGRWACPRRRSAPPCLPGRG